MYCYFFRMGQSPSYSAHNVGFRCAASAPHLVEKQKRQKQFAKSTPAPKKRRGPVIHRRQDMYKPPPDKTYKILRMEEL